MIFSMGEAIPVQHYGKSHTLCVLKKISSKTLPFLSFTFLLKVIFSVAEQLNKKFIDFLLDNIENNDHEQIPDLFVNLILAFNLHYEIPSENDVMKVLGERGTAKTFTEKVMLLVNRGGTFSCKCIEQCNFQI